MKTIMLMMMGLLSDMLERVTKNLGSKSFNKKDLMPTAWHPSRWWDWCMTGDKKKEIMVINMKLFCT